MEVSADQGRNVKINRARERSESGPTATSADTLLEFVEGFEFDAVFTVHRTLVVDARVHVAASADRLELASLLFVNQRHVAWIVARYEVAQRRFFEIAKPQ